MALKVYQKRKNEVQERRFFPERLKRRDTSLAVAIDDYLARVKGRIRSYADWLRHGNAWKPALPGRTLRAVTPGDVERYAARRRAEKMAPASVNRELTFLRCVYNVAIEDGLTDTSPVLSKFFVKENNARVRYLTDEEETCLREAIGEAEWPMIAVALHTGLRQSNQFHLRRRDVDFKAGSITVRRSKSGEAYHVPRCSRGVLRASAFSRCAATSAHRLHTTPLKCSITSCKSART